MSLYLGNKEVTGLYKGDKEVTLYKGDSEVFSAGGGNVVVIGGLKYRTVVMPDGNTWLAENLKLNDSSFVMGATKSNFSTRKAWYYNNTYSNYEKYGLIYDYNALKYLNDNRETFFKGWHVPSDKEWSNLITVCGGNNINTIKKLKATTSWNDGYNNGTDDYGFSILAGGGWDSGWNFGNWVEGRRIIFMNTTTSNQGNNSCFRGILDNNSSFYYNDKEIGTYGGYIRLVKDT